MLLGKIWNTQVPVYFYSNISIRYSWYINAFVSPMCIEGVIGRCCMCHAWQVRQGSHVAMWHFHNQQEAPYEDLQHQVMPNRSVRPSLLPLRFWDIGGSIGENDHNIPKWYPQCKDSTTWIILHPASSCIILCTCILNHPESMPGVFAILTRTNASATVFAKVGWCGLMWVDKSQRRWDARRCAEKCW